MIISQFAFFEIRIFAARKRWLNQMNATRAVLDQIAVKTSTQIVFEALVTPSDICQWWSAKTAIVRAEKDGLWIAAWGEDVDHPDFVTSCVLSVFEQPKRLVMSNFSYFSKAGPLPFEAAVQAEFLIQDDKNGAILSVRQSGFPADESADEFYDGCRIGWRKTLESMAEYLAGKN